jgi:hypothetical protein
MAKKPNLLLTPWRADKPDNDGCVRVYDKSNEEILVCQPTHAEAIVKAVNWCASRGYL